MKECLWCKKEYSPKRDTSKFCSTSCRVMHHHKFGKKDKVTSVQMQVLYNAIMGKLGGINYAEPQKSYDAPKFPSNFKEDEPLSFEKLKQEAAFKYPKSDYEIRLHSAGCSEDLQSIGREIERSSLSRFEKQRLQGIGQAIFNDKFNF